MVLPLTKDTSGDIWDAKGNPVAICSEDADKIIKACNSFPEAVKLLEFMYYHNSKGNCISKRKLEAVREFIEEVNKEDDGASKGKTQRMEFWS